MFEEPASDLARFAGPAGPAGPAAVRACLATLQGLPRDICDEERVDLLAALEELKAGAAAAQARAAADLDASTRAAQAAAGLPAEQLGRGVAAQVALARRESPVRGGQHLGLAKALVHEMPYTLAALDAGRLSEWRATLLVRETACLSREHRAVVDEALAADPDTLAGVGDRSLVARARQLAYRLDPESVTRRAARAEHERRVTLRPAPDTMANLGALLPVAQGVAAYAALARDADAARAAGDPRSRGQLMADLLVERVTGQTGADRVPLRVHLVMTDRALFRGDDEPAHVPGYGPVPAEVARRWLRPRRSGGESTTPGRDAGTDHEVWLRRVYTHPGTGELVAMDSRSRCFPTALREVLVARDQTCRTPWCDAPVRHADHARPHADGGPTSAANGQGLCERCNYDKQAPGWQARPDPGSGPGAHLIRTTTPTGHHYSSRPPPQPGWRPRPRSRIEIAFAANLRGDHAA